MDIFWNYSTGKGHKENINKRNLLKFKPEPLLKNLSERWDGSYTLKRYLKCPAAQEHLKNVFIVRSDIDFHFDIDISKNIIKSNNRTESFIEDNLLIRSTEEKTYSLDLKFLFFSEKNVVARQLPASFHKNEFTKNTILLPGGFDISKWFRYIEPAFIAENNTLDIKRGNELYYIKFDTKEKVVLKEFEMTPRLYDYTNSCGWVKDSVSNLSLSKLYNLFLQNNFNKLILKEIKNNLTGV